MKNLLILIVILGFFSCGESGPPTTQTESSSFKTLQEKIEFLQKYMTFKNDYVNLEYSISYLNNSKCIPAPTEYDISIYAKVSKANIALMLKDKSKIAPPKDLYWISDIPKIKVSNPDKIYTWYQDVTALLGVNDNQEFLYHIDSY